MKVLNNSSSSASISVFVDDQCYIANIGHSKIVLSSNQGQNIHQLNQEPKEKPNSANNTFKQHDPTETSNSLYLNNANSKGTD